MDYLSQRGRSNITDIMTKIPGAILSGPERTFNPTNSINLSMAENWLIRPEILERCKAAIADSLAAHVSDFPQRDTPRRNIILNLVIVAPLLAHRFLG